MPTWSINRRVRIPLLLMGSAEALVAFTSLYFAAFVAFGSIEESQRVSGQLGPRAGVIAASVLVSLIAMGLYNFHQRINFLESAVRVFVALTMASLALAVIYYAVPSVLVTKELASLAFGYTLTLLLLLRFVFVNTVDENVFRHRTLIYGAGKRAAGISDLRRRADRRGFQIVGKISAPGDGVVDDTDLIHAPAGSIADLAIERNADEIVVAMDNRRGNLPIRDLLDARFMGIDVIDLLEFLEREAGKIRVDLVNPGWLIFSPGFNTNRFWRFVKRLIDIVMSAVLAIVALPFVLLTTVAIKVEDGITAPVLYRQQRVGKGGKLFYVYKFRSMRVDAESDGQAKWAHKADSRVTRVGNVIRKFRIDEIPQLWNVLRGNMSIVGPRPERPEFVEQLAERIPYYSERHAVRPGVTGWAQLRYSYGATEEDAVEKLQYDLYYIKNHSLILDLLIILQTVEVVLWRKGAR